MMSLWIKFVVLLMMTLDSVVGWPDILAANRKDIQLIDAASRYSTTLVTDLVDATAVAYLYEDNTFFWLSAKDGKIKRTLLNDTTTVSDILQGGSPEGVACDWLARKLYWTDSDTRRIEVSSLDGVYRKVLFSRNLDKPRAIAVDPVRGYMYWTDWGEDPKIERAWLDGTLHSREILINTDIIWPNGLTLDYKEKKIYWTDAKLKSISFCDLDGDNRRQVVSGNLPHPFAITLFAGALYWSDWQTKSIHMCDKRNGLDRQVLKVLTSPMDIKVVSSTRQTKGTGVSPCDVNNGGCSHLCLLKPVKPFYSCACPTGFILRQATESNDSEKDDKSDCVIAEDIILVARRTDLRMIALGTHHYTDTVLDLSNVSHAVAIDYDPVESRVYWTDDAKITIQRALLDGTEHEVVVDTGIKNPDGIAVDWSSRKLYWTDTGVDKIEVSNLDGTSRRVLISSGLDEPRAICIDSEQGHMYWTDWGGNPRIERANLDGSGRVVLVNTSLGWPNGLGIDFVTGKMYWADAKEDVIEMANLDGSGRKTLISENVPHIFGFSLHGEYIYWTDWQRRAIERAKKSDGSGREIIKDSIPDLMGLKVTKTTEVYQANCAVTLTLRTLMTGAACGAGNAYPSGAPDFTSSF